MQKISLGDLMFKGEYRQFRVEESGPVYVLGYFDYKGACVSWLRDIPIRGLRSRVFPASKKVFEVPMAF